MFIILFVINYFYESYVTVCLTCPLYHTSKREEHWSHIAPYPTLSHAHTCLTHGHTVPASLSHSNCIHSLKHTLFLPQLLIHSKGIPNSRTYSASLTQSLTHSLTHSFTHSLIHSNVTPYSLTHILLTQTPSLHE